MAELSRKYAEKTGNKDDLLAAEEAEAEAADHARRQKIVDSAELVAKPNS
jgi:hypothetical protein